MAVSGDRYFVHAQNGGHILAASGSQGISQMVGSGTTTKTGYIGEGSRLLLLRCNLSVRNPRKCGSGWRSREQEMN